jgi:hypothetical protein
MLPTVDRSSEELNEALLNRLEMLAEDLRTLGRITHRGAVLPELHRVFVPSIKRLAMHVLDALETGGAATMPWDREKADASRRAASGTTPS